MEKDHTSKQKENRGLKSFTKLLHIIPVNELSME